MIQAQAGSRSPQIFSRDAPVRSATPKKCPIPMAMTIFLTFAGQIKPMDASYEPVSMIIDRQSAVSAV
jgi:hypothetical protein